MKEGRLLKEGRREKREEGRKIRVCEGRKEGRKFMIGGGKEGRKPVKFT
jgi:hypothetical protein